jgi:hypothetical protein
LEFIVRHRVALSIAAYASALTLLGGMWLTGSRSEPAAVAVLALALTGYVIERTPALRRSSMRKYRLHLYDGDYELLADETHSIAVDLDSPEGHAAAQTVLAGRARALIERARDRGDYVTRPRLELHDWLTGRKELDWPC